MPSRKIPNDVILKIREWAHEAYYDDDELYKIFIKEQSRDYLELNSKPSIKIPGWTWDSILIFTETIYSDDYSGQLFAVKQSIKNYLSIETLTLVNDPNKLREMKQSAREDFPGNYRDQLLYIENSLKTLKREKIEDNAQEIIKGKVISLKPKSLSSLDWELILNLAAKECPEDYLDQLEIIKFQIKSFNEILRISPIGNEKEFNKLKRLANNSHPGNYTRQLTHLISELNKTESITAKKHKYRPSLAISLIDKKPIKSDGRPKITQTNSVTDDNKKDHNSILFSNSQPLSQDNKKKESTVAEKNSKTLEVTKNEYKVIINSRDLIKPTITKECNFSDFIKKILVSIKVEEQQSFDAFNFESVNNRIIVIINSTHPFYLKFYRDASPESKNVIGMMISSLCHLSHLSTSKRVQKIDKELFSRWSQYLEEYLLEE